MAMNERRGLVLWAAAVLLALAPVLSSAQAPINLKDYYPLAAGDSWTYQFRTWQPDGQINYSLKTYSVAGTEDLKDGVKAVKLMDQRGWYYLLTVDEKQYLHWGENEDKGLITNDPPFAFYDTANAFGKTYQSAHK